MKRIDGWIGSLARGAVALLVVAGMTACEQEPDGPGPGAEALAGMEAGYGKQAVLNSLPEGPGTDRASSMQRGYRMDRYFLDGRPVEVLWVRPDSQTPLVELDRGQVTPVIFVEDTLDGWGWDHFERRHQDWGLVDRSVPEAERPPPASDPDA